MKGFNAKACIIVAGTMAFSCLLMVGCSPKPSTQDISKLQDQQSSTESVEKKLAEARQERIRLEQELQAKKVQLQESKQELKAQSAQPAADQKVEAPQAPTAGQVAPVPSDQPKVEPAVPLSVQPAAEQKVEAPQPPAAGQVAPAAMPEQAKPVLDTLQNKAK